MSGQSLFEHIVVGAWGRRHEFHAARFQAIPAFDEVVARECDVLDAFAFVFTKVFFDLTNLLRFFFVEGNANQSIWCRECSRDESSVFTFDVKVANL